MNRAGLFFDTETSGLPIWSQPSEHPDQPHIVQLAGLLLDLDTRQELQTLDVIIKPDGWTIPDEVAAIHGITTERAMDEGIPEREAIEALLDMWGQSSLRIAHNESFDMRIVRIGLKRLFPERENLADLWKAAPAYCTATKSTKLCAIPPTAKMKAAGRFHHKTPTLSEAYKHFTGKELEGAHSAMADTRGCAEVYFHLNPIQA